MFGASAAGVVAEGMTGVVSSLVVWGSGSAIGDGGPVTPPTAAEGDEVGVPDKRIK